MIALMLLIVSAQPVETKSEPLFKRAEPHLEKGADLLEDDEFDLAIEEFRRAVAEEDDERAIVEYDVGSALMIRAIKTVPPPKEGQPPPGPDKSALEDARAAFERAQGLARNPKIKSEAALAAGNAAALGGGIDDAIAAFRKALVADPTNQRAKANLRRALETKKQQQQQDQPESGDGEKKNDEKKEENEEQQQQQQQQQQQRQQQKQEDEKDGEKKDEKKEGEKKAEQQQQPQPQEGEKKDQKKQKREEARRLLDALRAREKPLTPLEMLGAKPTRPKDGKDW